MWLKILKIPRLDVEEVKATFLPGCSEDTVILESDASVVVSAVLDTGPNLSGLHAIYKEIKVNGCTLIPWSVAKTRREQNHAAHVVDVGLITNIGAGDVGCQNSRVLPHGNHVLFFCISSRV